MTLPAIAPTYGLSQRFKRFVIAAASMMLSASTVMMNSPVAIAIASA